MGVLDVIQAARPKTLPAAVVPVFLGCIYAWKTAGKIYIDLALVTLFAAICIQIATNFFNDAIDAQKGADTEKRQGPERVTASGKMTRKQVYCWAFGFLLMASLLGLYLMWSTGWIILLIGIPSLYLSYGYTGGVLPLAYRGLGELFVLAFFGWIAVSGTVFVQTGLWGWAPLVLGTQVGLLSAMLILINNIRDREEDSGTGKNTLAVVLGRKAAMIILWGMMIGVYCLNSYWGGWLPFLAIPLGGFICFGVSILGEGKGRKYNMFLGLSALHLLVFATLWSVEFSYT